MIKELMHDPIFLACKSEKATKEDITYPFVFYHQKSISNAP